MMMTTKIALQITIDSPCRRATDDLKKGVIINGETGEIEQREKMSDVINTRFSTDDLLKRADEVIDTVTIAYRQNRLLPSLDLPMVIKKNNAPALYDDFQASA